MTLMQAVDAQVRAKTIRDSKRYQDMIASNINEAVETGSNNTTIVFDQNEELSDNVKNAILRWLRSFGYTARIYTGYSNMNEGLKTQYKMDVSWEDKEA